MTPLHTILVVDPDPEDARPALDALRDRHRVVHAKTAAEARRWLSQEAFDLVVLELELPDDDGLILCSEIHSRGSTGVVVCTRRPGRREMILSFRLGADDFLGKPYDPAMLHARVSAVLRRVQPIVSDVRQRLGDLTIDLEQSRAIVGGQPLTLTQTEFRLLGIFAKHIQETLSREELARLAGGYEHIAGTRAVDMHVRRLRAKLRAATGRVPSIVAIRGVGYRLLEAFDPGLADGDAQRHSIATGGAITGRSPQSAA